MKILYVTTIGSTMTFFYDHFKMLLQEGNEIELACNLSSPLEDCIKSLGLKSYDIKFSRNPISNDNAKAYKQLKQIVADGNYDLVHTHTPNASVVVRFACRKFRRNGLKVFYTAHGFHFYKGAPLKNWIIYYPIEKICSYFTDKIITINSEDYQLAKSRLNAREACYIHGVGLNLSKFYAKDLSYKIQLRKKLNICSDDLLLISVGELNNNKNHAVIIKALSKLKNPNIKFIIAGKGNQHDELDHLIDQLDLRNQVFLLGYRDDVLDLYQCSDVFCFPSIREGLGMACLEAMACGLPLIVSNNRGSKEYCKNNVNGFVCEYNDVDAFAKAIDILKSNKELCIEMGRNNKEMVKKFSTVTVLKELKDIYK